MSTPTYGPDMFYSDITVPNPATVVNEPLPRAWTEGGIIESVKRAVVTGIRNGLRASSLSPLGGEDEKFSVDIEYPTEVNSYPGVWVQFNIESLQRAGLSHEVWTKEEGQWGPIHEWMFTGRITLTLAALSSKDRDRLADVIIAQLAFSRPSDLVLTNPQRDAKQFKGLITTIDENPYVAMTLNTDQINPGGQTMTAGLPWAPNQMLYEDTYSIGCTGQFNIRFRYDGIYELAEIRPNPTMVTEL